MKIKVDSSDWVVFESKEQFYDCFPAPKYGFYRPQPWHEPDSFPCIVKEICVIHNSNSPDDVVLCIEYDFIEEDK